METSALVQFDKARQALALARSVDEVKLVRDQAEALRLYVRQQGESLEMQNDVAEIKLRAERRAGELLAEIPRAQGKRTDMTSVQLGPKSFEQVLAENDIAQTTAKRWQTEATVPEEVFEQHVAEVKRNGEELTSAGLYRLGQKLNGRSKPHVSRSTGNNEWYTPPEYIEAARRVMGDIDLDPASSDIANEIVKARSYYTIQNDGLTQSWSGRVWMNPPYSSDLIGLFCSKLVDHIKHGDVTAACVLVNNATETAWFQRLLEVASCICLLRGRVRFIDELGDPSGSPLQGQIILYIGPSNEWFAEEFSTLGKVFYAW